MTEVNFYDSRYGGRAAWVLAAALYSGGVAAQTPAGLDLAAHCACMAYVSERYNPDDDGQFENPNMPTTGTEMMLNRWMYVERLYANCMRGKGAKPHPNPFPYGVSNYAYGSEFRRGECAAIPPAGAGSKSR